jgi:hypothetical protein
MQFATLMVFSLEIVKENEARKELSMSTKVNLVIGFLYGLSLTVVGVLVAGAGHGTYILLGIASAPASFLGIIFSVISPSLLWTMVWGILPNIHKSPQRQIFFITLTLHYFSILLIPVFEDYSEGKYIVKVWEMHPAMIILGFTIYLVGQVMIWLFWFRTRSNRKLA